MRPTEYEAVFSGLEADLPAKLAADVPSERPVRHLGYLDSLRGIAILGVLFVHAGFSVVDVHHLPLSQILFVGQRGVQLFYIVSAFTLFYTLDTQRRGTHPRRNFYLRRFFRIAPLFYLDLIFKALVLGPGMRLPVYLSAVVFLNGWSHTAIGAVPAGWSIAVEVTFYALVPFLFLWIRNLQQAVVGFLLTTAVSVPLCYALAHRNPGDFYTFLWFPAEAPVFMMGIVAYFLWKGRLDPTTAAARIDAMPRPERRGLSIALVQFGVALIFGMVNLQADAHGAEPWRNTHLLLASLGFIPLLLAVALDELPLLVNSFTRLVGRISYSIYLSHGYLMILLDTIHKRWFAGIFHGHLHDTVAGAVLSFVLLLLLSIPLSLLLWRFVEQPGIKTWPETDCCPGGPGFAAAGGRVTYQHRKLVGCPVLDRIPRGYFDPKISLLKDLDIKDIGWMSAKLLIPGRKRAKISLLEDLAYFLSSK